MNPFHRLAPAVSVAVLLTSLTGTANAESAESARIRELERKLERSMEMIEKLSSKLNQIEQATGAARETQAKAAQQTEKIEALERQVSEMGSGLSRRSADDGLPIHGFADVGLLRSTENNSSFTGRKGAYLGTMSLYMTPQFTDRVKSLIELAFEADENGNLATDLERLQLGYSYSDAATAWLGRFHTPYGYWNTAFHHGAQIQTSLMRPRFLDFEDKGGILPAHTTGGWLTGKLRTGSGLVGYDLYAGNAPQITNAGGGTGNLNMRMSGSTSYRTASGFNAWFEPRAVEGLRLGLHGMYAGGVIDDTPAANRTRLRISGAYAVYQPEQWEVMGEYYRFRNQDITGNTGSHSSWAGYAQVGYNFAQWTPYTRIERTKLDQADNYFSVQESGRSYRRAVIGLRYDLDPKAVIKVELNSTRKEDLAAGAIDNYRELRMQYAIRF